MEAQFTVEPVSVVQAEGLDAVFECLHSGDVNSYSLVLDNTTSVAQAFPPSDGSPARLTIPATQQYDNTVVRCRAVIREGFMVLIEISRNATLLVKETSVTTNIINSTDTITLSWNSEIINSSITYCVNINQTTLDSTDIVMLDPVCDLTGPEYTFTSPGHTVCDRFTFTVTPTEGEMRGTPSEPVTGFFTRAIGTGGQASVMEDDVANGIKSVIFEAAVPDCTTFTSYRVDSDLLSAPVVGTLEPLIRTSVSINFLLPTDRMTDVTVTLTDTNGIDRLVFENVPTSTHDIVNNITVSLCPEGDSLCGTISYIEGSEAPGALVCAMPMLNDQPDVNNMILDTVHRSESDNFRIPVPPGTYTVIAFDLENNNLTRIPFSEAADSLNQPIQVGGGNDPPLQDSDITSTKVSNGVEVNCPEEFGNCLVLVQSTANLNRASVGLIRSGDMDRIGNIATEIADDSIFVVVFTWSEAQSIFEGRISHISELVPPTTTPPTDVSIPASVDIPVGVQSVPEGLIAGVVIIIFFLIAVTVAIVVVMCIVVGLRRKRINQQEEVSMQLQVTAPAADRVDWSTAYPGIEQPNEAYSTMMNRNIAYEKPPRQRNNSPHNPAPPTATVAEYEEIEPVHEYEEVLPQRRAQYVNINTDI